jgi:hypothetical protein
MSTPNQQLAETICLALIEAGIANEKEINSLKSQILSGKVKAEDWYLAFENSLPKSDEVSPNGN